MTKEKDSLSPRWKCKYHIVFAPKFRHQAIYGVRPSKGKMSGKENTIELDKGSVIGVLKRDIIGGHFPKTGNEMINKQGPKEVELLSRYRDLLCREALALREKGVYGIIRRNIRRVLPVERLEEDFSKVKYKYGNRHFLCRGYFVDIVGRNQKVIAEYIRTQLVEDMATDKLSQPAPSLPVCRPEDGAALRNSCLPDPA